MISLRTAHLATKITAICYCEKYIFIGCGGNIRLYDIGGKFISNLQVFRASSIHGIKVKAQEELLECLDLLVWGQKSFAFLSYHFVKFSWNDFTEYVAEDWMLDVFWNEEHCPVVVYAHNILIQYKNLSTNKNNCRKLLRNCDILKISYCSLKCLLFSALLISDGLWENTVVLAGTIFGNILIWKPTQNCDEFGNAVPLHTLEGHKGSVFSLNYCLQANTLLSTSDDRSAILWTVYSLESKNQCSFSFWNEARISKKVQCYGHTARLWRSVLLPHLLITGGEDSVICVWNYQGSLLKSWTAHNGASIWALEATNDFKSVLSGGNDGSVKLWDLSSICSKNTLVKLPCLNFNFMHLQNKCDFARSVACLDSEVMIVTNNGIVCIWPLLSKQYYTVLQEDCLRKYSVIAIFESDKNHILLGTLFGFLLYFYRARDLKWVYSHKEQVSNGKIFSLFWLNSQNIISSGPDGSIFLWTFTNRKFKQNEFYVLPQCKQWWVSAASLFPENNAVVVGDRSGSIYLYKSQISLPAQSFQFIHGKNGVTCIISFQNSIFSSGRDGCIRIFGIKDSFLYLKREISYSVSWISKIIIVDAFMLFSAFHNVNFQLWSLYDEKLLVEFDCGGGHRSWDLFISFPEKLSLCFLKNCHPCYYQTLLPKNVLKAFEDGISSEIYSLECFIVNSIILLVSAGEDTLVRLHMFKNVFTYKNLGTFRNHLSSVRTLFKISFASFLHNYDKENMNVEWLVSASGRAQVKIWKVGFPELLDYDNCNEADFLFKEVANHMLHNNHYNWKKQEITSDPETRYMDGSAMWISLDTAIIILASSDGYLRLFHFQSKQHLSLVEEVDLSWCILRAILLSVNSDILAITTLTNGNINFWLLQYLYLIENYDKNIFLKLDSLKLSNSGINSLAALHIGCVGSISNFNIAAGADDGSLSVMKLWFNHITKKTSLTILSTVIVHAAQVTGLHWLNNKILLSSSVDQRIIVLKINSTENKATHLSCEATRFCHIPDIKGIKVKVMKDSGKHEVFVYGAGLEHFELNMR